MRFWVTGLILSMISIGCNETGIKRHIHHETKDTTAEAKPLYTCSMHPDIITDKPGQCPICGMTLTRKEVNTNISNDPADTAIKSSMNNVPVTTMQQRRGETQIEALGTIQNDTRQLATISAKVSGRIEKLYVRYRYQMIMPGDKIMDIYSPDLATAQQNLLFLLKSDGSNTSLIAAAKQRLMLIGMSDQQLSQLIKNRELSTTISVYSNAMGHIHEAGQERMEASAQNDQSNSTSTQPLSIREGMYVVAGQQIFSLTNPRKAWAVLSIFPQNQQLVKMGDEVTITPETMPGKVFKAHIDFIEPTFRSGSRTLAARVYFNNYQSGIPIGSQVRATIIKSNPGANWLPQEAIVSLGMNDVAFLKTATGFEARKILTGNKEKNQVQIISGLTATDSVAANAQYFTDSDSFIKLKQ